MQLTPLINVQIDGYGKHFQPGSVVSGAVLITTESAATVKEASVFVRSVISYPKQRRRRVAHTLPSKTNLNDDSKSQDQSTTSHSAERSSTGVHSVFHHGDSSEGLSEDWETETYQHSREFLKTDCLPLLDVPKALRPGITRLKFQIGLPETINGEDLIPSMQSRDGSAEVKVFYEVVASVKTPAPIFSSLSIPLVSHNQIVVVTPLKEHDVASLSQQRTAEASTRVGFWSKESRAVGKLVRYYLGWDTARSWSDVTLKVSAPLAVSVSDSFYLQERLRLSLSQQGYAKEKPNPATVEINVRSVEITLLTSVTVGSSMDRHTMWVEEPILKPQKYSFSFVIEDEDTDITALISGAKLSSSLPPSIDHTELHVTHWLRVSVSLESISVDGTRQVPSTTTVKLPISLSTCPRSGV